MALGGRSIKGRDPLQNLIWSENHDKIIYALMDKLPSSSTMKYLEDKTGLTRIVLDKHLLELEESGCIEIDNEHRVINLIPSKRYDGRGRDLKNIFQIPFSSDNKSGILIVRGKTNYPSVFQLNINDKTDQKTDTEYAKTISFTEIITQNLFKITPQREGTKLEYYQVMMFPSLDYFKDAPKGRTE